MAWPLADCYCPSFALAARLLGLHPATPMAVLEKLLFLRSWVYGKQVSLRKLSNMPAAPSLYEHRRSFPSKACRAWTISVCGKRWRENIFCWSESPDLSGKSGWETCWGRLQKFAKIA